VKTRDRRHGLVLVHTGEGKGKSSSAFGMVFRAAGWGMKVCVIQFIKGQWQTGEQKAAERFDTIEWHAWVMVLPGIPKIRRKTSRPAAKFGNWPSKKSSSAIST